MNNFAKSLPIIESYWVLPGRLMAGEYPGGGNDEEARMRLRWLLEGGISMFIDLTRPGEAGLVAYEHMLYEEASKYPIAIMHKRFPLQDFNTPSKDRMVEILDMIDLSLSLGKNVYLHCHGGKGRTGTTVGCYLVRHGWSGGAALGQIQKLRMDIPSHDELSPETEGQIRMVLEWKQGQ